MLHSRAVQHFLRADAEERNERVRAEVGAAVANSDVKERAGRVIMLIADLERTDAVMAERAAWPDHQDVPGGKTGIVVTEQKKLGSMIVKTHSVDTSLLKARQTILDAIAVEMGQRITKPGDGARKRVQDMSAEELRDLLEELTRFGAAQERRVNAAMGKPVTN